MKKHIICLGGSNTHGYCAGPADYRQVAAETGVRFMDINEVGVTLEKKMLAHLPQM